MGRNYEKVIKLKGLDYNSIFNTIKNELEECRGLLIGIIGKVDDRLNRIANIATVRALSNSYVKTHNDNLAVYLNIYPFYIEINLTTTQFSNDDNDSCGVWLHSSSLYELYDKNLHKKYLDAVESSEIPYEKTLEYNMIVTLGVPEDIIKGSADFTFGRRYSERIDDNTQTLSIGFGEVGEGQEQKKELKRYDNIGVDRDDPYRISDGPDKSR